MTETYIICENWSDLRKRENPMSEHLEIEFKTLVSPQDFKRLIDHFAIQKTDFFTQTNHYFDTDDF